MNLISVTVSTPSMSDILYKLKCVVCNQLSKDKVYEKFRFCEANSLFMFLEDVNSLNRIAIMVRLADIDTLDELFCADIYHQKKCYSYLQLPFPLPMDTYTDGGM